jgi:hypothetical protein
LRDTSAYVNLLGKKGIYDKCAYKEIRRSFGSH